MKKISRVLLLSIFLASCAAQRTSEVPTAALTLPPTETLAPATLTPEPTKDPLAGAPEGTTGKDAKGNWIKETAEGTSTWTVVNGPDGRPVLSMWTESRINPGESDLPGGFPPLIEISDFELFKRDSVPLNIVSQKGFAYPFLSHPDYPLTTGNDSFTTYFATLIIRKSGLSNFDAIDKINRGESLSIKFKNGNLDNTWKTNKGVLVIGMNPEELTQANFPDLVVCTSTARFDGNVSYTYTAFTTPEGQLVILTTTDHPETLTPTQALRMWVGPMENAVVSGSVSESNFLGTQRMVNSALRDVDPHFVIGPKQ